MVVFILHIEAPFNPSTGVPAQKVPKYVACRGLAQGGSGEATGLLGIVPPACRTFMSRAPQKVSWATYKGVAV